MIVCSKQATRLAAFAAAGLVALTMLSACGGSNAGAARPTSAGGGIDVNALATRAAATLAARPTMRPRSTPQPSPPPATSATPTSPPTDSASPAASPSAAPTPPIHAVGDTVRWNPFGVSATVYAVEQRPGSGGGAALAVDVERCALDTLPAGATQTTTPADFALALTNGRAAPPAATTLDGSYPAQQELRVGECARGWIAFELPAGATPDFVAFIASVPFQGKQARLQARWDATP